MGIKYYVNENFFKEWNPTMAYILGYFYADGSLENAHYIRGKYLRFTSTDKEMISQTKKALESKHTTVILPPESNTRKTRYFVRIGSQKLYNDLIKHGLTPNKSLNMRFPEIPHDFLSHFVRGYFDGDGHVAAAKNQNGSTRLIIVFVSGSLHFLTDLAKTLDQALELKMIKVYRGWRCYRLAYSTRDSTKIFKFLYKNTQGLFLRRKFRVFKTFYTDYNKWVDRGIANILNNSGHVVK